MRDLFCEKCQQQDVLYLFPAVLLRYFTFNLGLVVFL